MAEEKKKKYRTRSAADIGVKNDKGELTEVKHVPAGGEVELTEREAVELQHLLVDGPKLPKKVGERELEDDELEALDSIRKRPDNLASGVQLHWQTDTIAVNAAEAAAQGAESPEAVRRASSGQEDTEAVAHGFARAPDGPGGLTDPTGIRGAGWRRPVTNVTEMEREEEPKIRKEMQQQARKQSDMAKAAMGIETKKMDPPPAKEPPKPASPAAQNTK